ncbi:flagellar basal body-associated FliL family protein [Amaricoccus sp.]|uniref:flagellar basal body-associated FliL family protein n=1 Tax=Amaricoccus sp. TaxID=1872485 RepID=UPI001B43E4EA|nr:flagellar basal body-associated FliL family protein [Amaricoccus sp.]MBP7243370.1 flagellar basal body-associated FliL family protein [Amaricoccus sp.]
MSNAAPAVVDAPEGRRKGKGGLAIGLVAALALGGGGFYAVWSGMVDPAALLAGGGHGAEKAGGDGSVAFVAMEPIMISLPPGASARHLRFAGQLEVEPAQAAEVASVMPRVVDALNTYLRAVDVRDLENPAALQRLRAQMLRRVQVVAGEGKVRDLLVAEFVLN